MVNDTNSRSDLKDKGITSALKNKFDVKVNLKSIYSSVVNFDSVDYTGTSGNFVSEVDYKTSIWSMYRKVKTGEAYDPSLTYSESEFEYYPYSFAHNPAAHTDAWRYSTENGETKLVATTNNDLYVVDYEDNNKILYSVGVIFTFSPSTDTSFVSSFNSKPPIT